MNNISMVHTDIKNDRVLSTDNIQLQLKPIVRDAQQSASQASALSLVILPKNEDTISVNSPFEKSNISLLFPFSFLMSSI